jgi:predicted acylesterase/phospholipase RssA
MRALLAKIKFLISRIAEAWQLLRLTLFSALFVILGGIFLVWIPQGQDLLRILAGETRNPYFRQHQIFFVIASLTWAIAAWYCARVLVTRRLRSAPPDNMFQVYLRIWLPRIYGALALFSLAHGFWKVGQFRWSLVYAVFTLLFFLYMVKRRAWFGNFPGTVKTQVDSLPSITRKLIHWSLGLSFALLLAFTMFNVWPAQMLGGMAILLFAFTSWIIFGSFVLVLLPKIYGWPSLALLPVFLFIVFSPFNDNHIARKLADYRQPDCQLEPSHVRCQKVSQHFKTWMDARNVKSNAATYPIYIIAAEGGGIRAAYWTAAVLTALHERDKNFSQHVYAISGVSGGALGAGVYAAFLADMVSQDKLKADCANNLSACARSILSQDFLSPTLAATLYPDLIQRFVPFPLAICDRARALEYSWESAWTRETGNQRFGEGFHSLWQGRDATLPSLFLNSTLVETGQRVIVSNHKIDASEFHDALDGFAAPLQLPEPPLSTAIHYSSRFAVVSPAARVPITNGNLHLVDGGYHENTGALTASEVFRAVEKAIARENLNAKPVMIVIRNEPVAQREYKGSEFLGELLHPINALLETRKAHAANYLDSLAAALNRDNEPQQFFVVQPPEDSEQAPLGWFMSLTSTASLDRSLVDAKTTAKLDEILSILQTLPAPKPMYQETRP